MFVDKQESIRRSCRVLSALHNFARAGVLLRRYLGQPTFVQVVLKASGILISWSIRIGPNVNRTRH
jgi:hypothetical protein